MKPLRHAAAPRRASLPGAAAELCDRKGARVVAKAGTATVKDQGAATVEKEAVLSDKILHECRVFFNDFGGYRAQATMGAAMLEPLTAAFFSRARRRAAPRRTRTTPRSPSSASPSSPARS